MEPHELFKRLIGKWEGTCRTWFEPDQLADESKILGEFLDVFDGRFVRHRYESSLKGQSRTGEEWIAFNGITQAFQIAWIDDFHMNYAIQFSQGKGTERGFSVLGEYAVGPDIPCWLWRTEYDLIDAEELIITAYNISPEGMEAKAVETIYERLPLP